MKNLKTAKIMAGIIAMTMVMGLSSCGESSESSTAENTSSSSTSSAESQAETTSQQNESEEESSAVEEDEYQYGVISIDVHFKFSKHFDFDCRSYNRISTMCNLDDEMYFGTISKLCNEYNNLTIDADKPEEWLDTVQDRIAEELSGAGWTLVNPAINIESQEIQEINGRTFVRFVGSFHDDDEDRDVTMVGYLTVVDGDPNLSEYKEDNTAGFLVAQHSEVADIDVLDGYAREAAESMTVGKSE